MPRIPIRRPIRKHPDVRMLQNEGAAFERMACRHDGRGIRHGQRGFLDTLDHKARGLLALGTHLRSPI